LNAEYPLPLRGHIPLPFLPPIIADGELVSTLRLVHMERGLEPLADHVTLRECGIAADGSALSLLIEDAGTSMLYSTELASMLFRNVMYRKFASDFLLFSR
jgi:hypothetical protein